MVPETRVAAPRRRTRPSNRRELILAAARELFYRRGFDHVGVGEIAAAVAIGPSALYRHFESKQQLLADVLEREHALLMEALGALGETDQKATVRALARMSLDFRGGSLLIQREARHLPAEGRARVRDGSREIGAQQRELIRRFRPDLHDDAIDLLGWAAIGVISSTSVHRLDLPRAGFEAVLRDLLSSLFTAPVPATLATVRREHGLTLLRPHSRRENLLRQAVQLFAERGYANVAVEDVGATLGIAGPSIYNHFPAKVDLLQTPMKRGIAYLLMNLASAFDGAVEPGVVLRRLIRSHVAFSLDHPDLLELLLTEVRHLPDSVEANFRRAQREYLQEWGELLRRAQPGLDVVEARIRVQAVVTMVGDVVRIRHLRGARDLDVALVDLCDRLLLD